MSQYFEKQQIELSGKKLVAIFTAYNEAERIPFFLSYYRSLGVAHFLAIDNNSTDETSELLKSQSDVTYFHTEASYAESKAGRLWTSELANAYCVGLWCLTLDLDELLVFPGHEHVSLTELCNYLDEHGYEGVFTVFLDMYSGNSLNEAIYKPGQSFFEVCDYFETSSYTLTQPMHFPHIGVFGGPRQRIFWQRGNDGNGPSMRKLPLVKWQRGFKYLYSTHSSTPINLADVTAALLHFKFFSSFGSFAMRELARGDRVQTGDYERYARLTKEENVKFKNENSIRYESSVTLVEHGVTVCTRRFLNWIRPGLNKSIGGSRARKIDNALRQAMKDALSNAVLKLPQLPVVWQLLASSCDGGVIAVRDRTILGWFHDRGGGYDGKRQVEGRADGKVVCICEAGIEIGPQSVIPSDFREGLFQLTVPKSVFKDREQCRIVLTSRRDSVPFASVSLKKVGELDSTDPFAGICYITQDGRISGWVWTPAEPQRNVALTLHIDGQFWCRVVADRFREALLNKGIGDGAHGFLVSPPEWLKDDVSHVLNVVIHGTNLQLQNSPLSIERRKGEKIYFAGAAGMNECELFMPAIRARVGNGILGEIVAVRRGTIFGWVADESNDARTLTLEVKIGDRVTTIAAAGATLPVVSTLPDVVKNHCFAIPVFARRYLGELWRKYENVSIRVVETGDVLVEGLTVAAPQIGIQRSPYRGYCDQSENGILSGWAWRVGDADHKVEVGIFIDGNLLARVTADDFRQDLREVGIGRGYHSFAVALPEKFKTGVQHSIDAAIADEGIPLAPRELVVIGKSVRIREGRRFILGRRSREGDRSLTPR